MDPRALSMDVRGTAAGTVPLTKRSGRTVRGRIAPLVVLAVAAALTGLALARLDPVYRQVPGVYFSWQLTPALLDVRHEASELWSELAGDQPDDAVRVTRRKEAAGAGLKRALEGSPTLRR